MVKLATGIYKITNTVNGKVYIGQSIDIERRHHEHNVKLNNNNHHNSYLQNSWNKYGESKFSHEIIEKCDVSQLNDREEYWISKYDSFNNNLGYNLTSGGGQGTKVSDITKKKLSDQRIGKFTGEDNPFFGKTHSEELKERVRQMNIENCGDKHYFYGKHHSEETKAKTRETIGESRVGSSNSNSKITEEIALNTIRLLLQGHPQLAISKHLGVSVYIVTDIKCGKRWKHLTNGLVFPNAKYKVRKGGDIRNEQNEAVA